LIPSGPRGSWAPGAAGTVPRRGSATLSMRCHRGTRTLFVRMVASLVEAAPSARLRCEWRAANIMSILGIGVGKHAVLQLACANHVFRPVSWTWALLFTYFDQLGQFCQCADAVCGEQLPSFSQELRRFGSSALKGTHSGRAVLRRAMHAAVQLFYLRISYTQGFVCPTITRSR
jgi:hypothetical protein